MKKVGIDSLSYYVPSLYVDIEELARARDIPSEKLVKGLGLINAGNAALVSWDAVARLGRWEIGRAHV